MLARREFYVVLLLLMIISFPVVCFAQKTQIRGFVDALGSYADKKVSFGLGEQDLFITSELSDRISFLGESVFKFSVASPTSFDVSIERVVLKYNFYRNHNLLVGKQHTPINYWNYTYHHGRVFFPTIERPLLFAADIIPLHTTGVGLQANNLGANKLGYNLMIGNGLGSSDVLDNDKRKSITAELHVSPFNNMTVGAAYYNDALAKGTMSHSGHMINWQINQHLYSAVVAYFGPKVEFLSEASITFNHSDTTGTKRTFAAYAYGGVKIRGKLVPYVRVDKLSYQTGEMYYSGVNRASFIAGCRYEINYLAVVKLEFQHSTQAIGGTNNVVSTQFAIGF